MKVELQDVTPDYTCYALQGPRSTEVLEALTGESWKDLRFSRFRKSTFSNSETIVSRQGVTGEIGYEFLMRTDTGRAHELWRKIREVGRDFGLRELGFKAQLVGHTETGIATVIRDFIPARGTPEQLRRMLRHWMSAEEHAALDWDVSEHLCSPAELGWAHTIDLTKKEFHGREASAQRSTARSPPGGPGMVERGHGAALRRAVPRRAGRAAARPAVRAVPRFVPEDRRGRLGLRLRLQPDAAAHDLARPRRPRRSPTGAEVRVRWGGFSDEPVALIRAKVVALPFISGVTARRFLRYPSVFLRRKRA